MARSAEAQEVIFYQAAPSVANRRFGPALPGTEMLTGLAALACQPALIRDHDTHTVPKATPSIAAPCGRQATWLLLFV